MPDARASGNSPAALRGDVYTAANRNAMGNISGSTAAAARVGMRTRMPALFAPLPFRLPVSLSA